MVGCSRKKRLKMWTCSAKRVQFRVERSLRLAVCGTLLCWPLCAAALESVVTYPDRPHDTLIRKTDFAEKGQVKPAEHRLINLLDITIGQWWPPNPQVDPFAGRFNRRGDFMRLNLTFAGLVNPPGIAGPREWEPFVYGPHPIYGFIEVDMDADVNTGGELDFPCARYLGNVVRFGGKTSEPRFADRVATCAADCGLPFDQPPFVKRHGEEFHLAFLGKYFRRERIRERVGNGNTIFEQGEIWRITGLLFHRAHGFKDFSFAEGCHGHGEYLPDVDLEFLHDMRKDVTVISLVMPLTNMAAARMRGEPPEKMNGSDCDQTSVAEALHELALSAKYWKRHPGGPPEKHIIVGWADKNPLHHLHPTGWLLTAVLGTTYVERPGGGATFVWTDVFPNVFRGDVNGDKIVDGGDERLILQYIMDNGGGRGFVEIPEFAEDFSLFDINYSGAVDQLDVQFRPRVGDGDGDDDVDLVDFALFQSCFSGPNNRYPKPHCIQVDWDRDRDIDLDDWKGFVRLFRGPNVR